MSMVDISPEALERIVRIETKLDILSKCYLKYRDFK